MKGKDICTKNQTTIKIDYHIYNTLKNDANENRRSASQQLNLILEQWYYQDKLGSTPSYN